MRLRFLYEVAVNIRDWLFVLLERSCEQALALFRPSRLTFFVSAWGERRRGVAERRGDGNEGRRGVAERRHGVHRRTLRHSRLRLASLDARASHHRDPRASGIIV